MTNPARAIHSTTTAEPDRATHAVQLSAEVPTEIQLLPGRTFSGMDGRGPYQVESLDALIAASAERAGGRDLPIDYDHALENEAHGTSAPASGWITRLEARGDELWGHVTWTAAARQRIADREYRFISPVFFHDKEGRVLWLARAGLTNKPNLPIRSLNSTTSPTQESLVSEQLKAALARILGVLSLPATADVDAIVARCQSAVEAETALGKVVASMKLDAKATADDVVRAVQASVNASPDLTKYVPREQYDNLATQLKAAQQRDGERVIDDAIKAGKVLPATREYFLSMHQQNPKATEEFLAKQPAIVSAQAEQQGKGDPAKGELTADAKSVCAALGVDEAEFKKNLPTT